MNLALGTLYGWSVFVAPLEERFGWKRADTSMVFTIAVIVFALSFVVAGRIQDKFGPLACSLAGGILVSLGFYLCSYTTSLGYLYQQCTRGTKRTLSVPFDEEVVHRVLQDS